MKRAAWAELSVVLVAAAVLGCWGRGTRPRVTPPAACMNKTAYTILIDGIAPGMSRDETERILGKPSHSGRARFDTGVCLSYAYYGLNTDPYIIFSPYEIVQDVVGGQVECSGRLFNTGEYEPTVSLTLGTPTCTDNWYGGHKEIYNDGDNQLRLFFMWDQVTQANLISQKLYHPAAPASLGTAAPPAHPAAPARTAPAPVPPAPVSPALVAPRS